MTHSDPVPLSYTIMVSKLMENRPQYVKEGATPFPDAQVRSLQYYLFFFTELPYTRPLQPRFSLPRPPCVVRHPQNQNSGSFEPRFLVFHQPTPEYRNRRCQHPTSRMCRATSMDVCRGFVRYILVLASLSSLPSSLPSCHHHRPINLVRTMSTSIDMASRGGLRHRTLGLASAPRPPPSS
jgi:hypothetical protein